MKLDSLRLILVATIVVGFSLIVFAQIAPYSKLRNFKLPLFNEEGYRAYILSGMEGILQGEEAIEVTDITVDVFSGDEQQTLTSRMTSNQAFYDIQTNTISGPGTIEIEDDNFQLEGNDWELDLENKNMVINESVRIQFYQKLDFQLNGVL